MDGLVAMLALALKEIRKAFGPTVALDGVDLELRPGEVHALIGENGAGKSTLMNVIAGALKPDAGHMKLDGNSYSPTNPFDARTRGIALIHQELSLCPHLSVAENVQLGCVGKDCHSPVNERGVGAAPHSFGG